MAGCRITKWSTELGRGVVATGAGEIPFDAAIADVADFAIGEEVDVTLVRDGAGYRVTRIAPVAWRVPPAPRPCIDLEAIAEAVRDRAVWLRDFDGDDLVVAIEHETYEKERVLVFGACTFVQMPLRIEDVATIRAFAVSEFVRNDERLTASWPAFYEQLVVFRIEPRFHAQGPGYIVAESVAIR